MKSFLSSLCLLLLLSSPAWAQVVYDAVSTGTYVGSASPFEFCWSHTVGAGSNRYLRVGVSYPADAITVTGILFGAQALSSVSTVSRAEMWELVNPTTSTDDVCVTMSASQNVVAGALSFSGVDQSTPSGTATTATSGDPTSVSITVPTDGMASDVMAALGTPTLTPGGSQTQRYNLEDGNTVITGAGSTQTTSGTMEWANGTGVGLIAAPINPAAISSSRRQVIIVE